MKENENTTEGTQNTSVGWSDPAKRRGPTYTSKPCSDCGKELPRAEFRVGKKSTRGHCRECHKKRQHKTDRDPRSRFSQSRCKAKKRGDDWTLTLDEWKALIANPCFYCGGELTQTGRCIDRRDNTKGYHPGNCVACCAPCNQMKNGNILEEEMIEMGALMRKFRERRAQLGLPKLEAWQACRRKGIL